MNKRWRRLSYINPGSSLFGTNNSQFDVIQGALGDCYFLAGAHAFSEYDDLFSKIFVNQQVSLAGIWAFNVYIRGVPTVITIDDYVPSFRKKPLYSKIGKDGSVWMPLLEKAFAKAMGNFENIEGGYHAEPLRFLGAAPTYVIGLAYMNE